jgi:hypothetical protein
MNLSRRSPLRAGAFFADARSSGTPQPAPSPLGGEVTCSTQRGLADLGGGPLAHPPYELFDLWEPRTMTILSLARLPLRRDGHFHC